MTAREQEIERLQRKLKALTEAYSSTLEELNRIKKQEKKGRRGRPGLSRETRARILALRGQGLTLREIAEKTEVSLGAVCRVTQEAKRESRVVYVYFDREEPATLIDTCGLTREVAIVNFTKDLLSRAFGIRENPDWEDFLFFLEDRCMPRSRYGIRDELRDMGIDAYDPFQIIARTKGRVHGDGQWIKQLDKAWVEAHETLLARAGRDMAARQELLQLFREEAQNENTVS